MAVTNKAIQKDDSVILLISALTITFLMFFIDEGALSLHWMADIGSWILFIMYSVFIFMGEVFVSNFILKKYHGVVQTVLSVASGSGLGILFVVYVVMRNW
jgi:hypothetical protein